jgi:hypothetical protein
MRLKCQGAVVIAVLSTACASGGSVDDGPSGNFSGVDDAAASDATAADSTESGSNGGDGDGSSPDDGGLGMDDGSSGNDARGDDGGGGDEGGGGKVGDAGMGSDAAGGGGDAMAADPCSQFSDECSDCVKGRTGFNCGWCGSTCHTGTSGGPSTAGVCGSASWVWKSNNCP